MLALQNISWLTRKAIGLATVTSTIQHYASAADPASADAPAPAAGEAAADTKGDAGAPVAHIDMEQHLTGGIRGTTEERTLDWQWRSHANYLFGEVEGRSRYTSLGALAGSASRDALLRGGEADAAAVDDDDVAFLRQDWAAESRADAADAVVESCVVSESGGWRVWIVWGFAEVEGKRCLVRRLVCRRNPGEVARVRFVYEWVDAAGAAAATE